ncbi:MAG TPA: rhomboid family intramembrane serine protease [Polyangiales bacterium]|jgi:GlpG protein|nr:rhomboid family intramembrane serine protease [Polyangiales bacterium]
MRLLTTVTTRAEAQTLGDALYADGVPTTIKETRDGDFAVWVHDEEHMEKAKAFLGRFDPDESRFAEMARRARAQKREEAKADEKLRARTEKIRRQIEAKQSMRVGTITAGLIVICVIVFIFTGMGRKMEVVRLFTFVPMVPVRGGYVFGDVSTIWQGQPWRLLTPMFLHFGFLHILFNMWWLKDLGTAIERAFSARYLLMMVLVIAVFSHVLEFAMSGPTTFGGMSGVVYGLFAFIWIRGRLDPSFPYRMPQQLVTFMLIWLALGFTGWVGPIANWVHSGGLIAGAAWGVVSSGHLGRRRR